MAVVRLIRGPAQTTLQLLKRRVRKDAWEEVEGKRWDAIGLVQANIPEVFAIADLAVKTANVTVIEVPGQCPQHLSTIAILGDMEAVETALAQVEGSKK